MTSMYGEILQRPCGAIRLPNTHRFFIAPSCILANSLSPTWLLRSAFGENGTEGPTSRAKMQARIHTRSIVARVGRRSAFGENGQERPTRRAKIPPEGVAPLQRGFSFWSPTRACLCTGK